MPTNFPNSLDNFTNPTSSDSLNTIVVLHSIQHSDENDAIEALEAWVGISGTSEQASHEYRIKSLENTPPGMSQFGVVGQDEGVTLGTGTFFNVVGDDIVLSLSGTVLNLLHTNPTITFPQEVIGIYGQDEGTPLGTGTVLNAVGNNISLSISGSVLQLTHTDTPVTFPQELIGVMGWSAGVPLGTGTVLNVEGSSLSLSGTVLRLFTPSPVYPQSQIGIFGKDEGQSLGTGTILNVVGSDIDLSVSGTTLTLTHTTPAISAQDEGSPLGNVTVFNFVGGGVVATVSGTVAKVFVTGSPSFNDAEGNPADDVTSSPLDGTSIYAARRDHSHRDNLPPRSINSAIPGWDTTPINDYASGGADNIIATVSTVDVDLTGISGGIAGNIITLSVHPASTKKLTLKNQSVLSTIPFKLSGLQDFVMTAGDAVQLRLEGAGTFWTVFGSVASTAQGVKIDPALASVATTGDVLTYDGSKMTLLPKRVMLPFSSYNSLSPMTASTVPYACTVDRNMAAVKFSEMVYVHTNNSGNSASSHWAITVKRGSDNATILNFNTASYTAGVKNLFTTTSFSISSLTSADLGMEIAAVKTGTPGDLYLYGPLMEVDL